MDDINGIRIRVGAIVGAMVGGLIGNAKGRTLLGLLLGFFLGCIGWIIIAVIPRKESGI